MHALLAIVLAPLVLLAAQPALAPPPTATDLAAAEATVQEVFGADLAAARKPADRAAVARRMLDTATDSDPAERFALFTQARELAIAAKDSAAGVQAAEGLAGFAGPSDASEGHRLWNAARDLAGKLAAAEVYLRALDGLEGFRRTAVEGRLRGLGWRVSVIDFSFDESTEGWRAGVVPEKHVAKLRAEDGCLVGQITGTDPYVFRKGLAVDSSQCPVLEIRLTLDSAAPSQFFWITKREPRWADGKVLQWPAHGGGQPRVYRLNLGEHPKWAGQTIIAIRVDPGERARGRPYSERFAIDYIRGLKQ